MMKKEDYEAVFDKACEINRKIDELRDYIQEMSKESIILSNLYDELGEIGIEICDYERDLNDIIEYW